MNLSRFSSRGRAAERVVGGEGPNASSVAKLVISPTIAQVRRRCVLIVGDLDTKLPVAHMFARIVPLPFRPRRL